MNWTYGDSDPALMLFTASVQRFGLDLPADAKVLELGCAETDFAERLIAANPSVRFWGVDVRRDRDATGWRQIVGSAIDPGIVSPGSFDAIVLLGALEHFGLGFYGDPLDEDGDTVTMQNIVRWLKPGGWVYFDVPCNPCYSVAENRHFRTYSPESVGQRLIVPGLTERARGYSDCEPHAGTWLDGPPESHQWPYHYVAVVADKVPEGTTR